ncbi:MAG: gliding motility-associated C-terminal domain-containing protein [Bacteroidetes bacterium]|nr:gliding motility-associated C-terminal domain-containing protein [Bacteroidota bacterium]
MKKHFSYIKVIFLFLLLSSNFNIYGHSVQVGYCVSCSGELTLYVEHWHANSDPNSTTMTINLNINGVTSSVTGSPIDNIQDTPYSGLPGCNDPITIFGSCSGKANTYNDWVVFKFPNLPTGVPIIITVVSGSTVFTEDGCNMYPASSPQIIVPPIINPPPVADSSQSVCTGESVNLNLTSYFAAFQWQSASAETGPWTDVPGATATPFNTGALTETTYFRATSVGTCESNFVTITVNPAVVPTSGSGPGTGAGAAISACPSNVPANIGTPTTAGYTYSWLPTGGLSSAIISNPTASINTPNTTTTYTLSTTTDKGCTATDSVKVVVKAIPVSNAGADINTCSSNNPGTIGTAITVGYTYSWSPATNLSSTTISNPNVILTSPGTTTYTVTSTSQGCISTDSVIVKVNPFPVADFTVADVCLNRVMNFNDLSTITIDNIVSWLWSFGDNSPAFTAANPTYTYVSPGTYNVTLIVATNNGCKDTLIKSAVVHPNPNAAFSYSNVCDDTPVPFNNLSSILTPDIIQLWAWDFNDGSALNTNQSVTGGYLYTSPGSYNVQLLTVSDFGCADSITKTVFVNPNPSVVFTSIDTAGCEPLCAPFQNLSSILTGSNIFMLMDFGDGNITSSQDLLHCYTNSSVYSPAYYSPSLTVTSDSGCVTTVTKNNYITVFPNPISAFTVESETVSIINPVVSTSNLSIGGDFWNWNFGDSYTASVFSPAGHTYADTGTYLITLITSTQYNCIDTTFKTIIVEPDFAFYVPNMFSPNGDGINDSFNGKGILIDDYEMKIFDRWGNMVFITKDIKEPWDGKTNYGTGVAQEDVYVYVIILTDFKRKQHDYRGIVTLVR